MILNITFAIIAIFLSDVVLYKLNIISSINSIFVFIVITIFFGIITLILMALRVDFYSKKDILTLVKVYKVEE